MFEIPHYAVKQRWLGELHPTTTEKYLSRHIRARNIESVGIELIENRVIVHAETVVSLIEIQKSAER